MRRVAVALALCCVAAAACSHSVLSSPDRDNTRPRRSAEASPPGRTKLSVQKYKGGLDFPVDMAWVPGTDTIFFTEKNTGKVRVLIGRHLLSLPCAELEVAAEGERGALGIALDPRFRVNRYLYVYYTNRSPLENRVTRFIVRHNRCVNPKNIVTGLSASSAGYHNGGQLEFDRGKLFVSVGEAHDAANAQNLASRLGKILRYNPDGSIPQDNPFDKPGHPNPVWSYGHRNPFGLAVRPETHQLFESENGPDCDDELNLIARGANYGWGNGYQCQTAGVGPGPMAPLMRWTPTIVPTDLCWYSGRISSLSNSLFMGDFSQGGLHRFVLNPAGTRVVKQTVIYRDAEGIVDVSNGPGGWLYFATPSAIDRIVSRL